MKRKLLALLLVVCMLCTFGCQKSLKIPKVEKIKMGQREIVLPDLTKQEYRSVAYFTSWSAYARNTNLGNIDPKLLTHVNFAFANLDDKGNVVVGDPYVDTDMEFGGVKGHYNMLKKVKEDNPHLKTLISIGGWTWSTNFSGVAADAVKRKAFVDSAIKFVTDYGFDGIDIDWEYPVAGGDNIPHRAEDKDNYTLLVKETREAFDELSKTTGKDYLITIAGAASDSFVKHTNLKDLMKYLDFINLMTYDYHGSWENIANHNTPLYTNSKDPSDEKNQCIENTVRAYLEAGVDGKDINLGLAFYGRGWNKISSADQNGLFQTGAVPEGTGMGLGTWESGVFDFNDLDQNYVNKTGYTKYYDEVAQVPYLFNGDTFISYDDEVSITAKLQFSNAYGLGGVMFWEYYGDKDRKLQTVIADYYGLNGREQKAIETVNLK